MQRLHEMEGKVAVKEFMKVQINPANSCDHKDPPYLTEKPSIRDTVSFYHMLLLIIFLAIYLKLEFCDLYLYYYSTFSQIFCLN